MKTPQLAAAVEWVLSGGGSTDPDPITLRWSAACGDRYLGWYTVWCVSGKLIPNGRNCHTTVLVRPIVLLGNAVHNKDELQWYATGHTINGDSEFWEIAFVSHHVLNHRLNHRSLVSGRWSDEITTASLGWVHYRASLSGCAL